MIFIFYFPCFHPLFPIFFELSLAVIRKRGPERMRNEIKDIQTQETIEHDLSRMKLLQKLTVDFMNPWYHEMLLHIRRLNAFHWKQYVLENPLNEWEQRLKLFHGNNWLTEKRWYQHSNRNIEVFYQELVKLL